jgi:hypothetical protein
MYNCQKHDPRVKDDMSLLSVPAEKSGDHLPRQSINFQSNTGRTIPAWSPGMVGQYVVRDLRLSS